MSTAEPKARVAQAAERYRQANEATSSARRELQDAIRDLIKSGVSEVEAAKLVGVTRMTIRSWLGKR